MVERAKGREADPRRIDLTSAADAEKQKRLGTVVAEFRSARYLLGDKLLLRDFTYDFRQKDRIGIVGPNG